MICIQKEQKLLWGEKTVSSKFTKLDRVRMRHKVTYLAIIVIILIVYELVVS